ncbi:MAG: hypothetical protein PHT13_08700, partial [Methanosarcina sp.]|nr:hypothetical protein [Methanosarcina sp.]
GRSIFSCGNPNFDGNTMFEIGSVTKVIHVAPRLVPINHPLAVKGTLNVASIDTELAGGITVTGKGAGPIETASAVLSDLVAIYGNR